MVSVCIQAMNLYLYLPLATYLHQEFLQIAVILHRQPILFGMMDFVAIQTGRACSRKYTTIAA